MENCWLNHFYNKIGATILRRELSDNIDDETIIDNAIGEYIRLSINYELPVYKPIAIIIRNSPSSNISFSDFRWKMKKENYTRSLFDMISLCETKGLVFREYVENGYDYSEEKPKKIMTSEDLLTTDDFYLISEVSQDRHFVHFDNTEIDLSGIGIICYQSTGFKSIDDCKKIFDKLNVEDKSYLSSFFKSYQIYFLPQLFSTTDFKLIKLKNGYDVSSRYDEMDNRYFKSCLNDAVYKIMGE